MKQNGICNEFEDIDVSKRINKELREMSKINFIEIFPYCLQL